MGTLDLVEPTGASGSPLFQKKRRPKNTEEEEGRARKGVPPNTRTHLGAEVLVSQLRLCKTVVAERTPSLRNWLAKCFCLGSKQICLFKKPKLI